MDQNSNSAVAQCLLEAGIDIPDGLFAETNGLWTPSDDDGLFTNPIINQPSGGVAVAVAVAVAALAVDLDLRVITTFGSFHLAGGSMLRSKLVDLLAVDGAGSILVSLPESSQLLLI